MRSGAAWAVGAGFLFLAACTGSSGGDTPRRPALDVADGVTGVDRDMIVGTWQCRELNPYPELPQQVTTITYKADGTFTGEGRTQARPPFGPMTSTSSGKWRVEDGQIVTSDVAIDAGSEDAFTNVMAGITSSIANTLGMTQAQGAGDVLELSRNRLTFRPVGIEDPPTFSCTR